MALVWRVVSDEPGTGVWARVALSWEDTPADEPALACTAAGLSDARAGHEDPALRAPLLYDRG